MKTCTKFMAIHQTVLEKYRIGVIWAIGCSQKHDVVGCSMEEKSFMAIHQIVVEISGLTSSGGPADQLTTVTYLS